jgi:putative sugar O-methyltransferase
MQDQDTFKSSSINYSFSLFNPRIFAEFYLKTVIYFVYDMLSDESLERLRKIDKRNRHGNPITIKKNGDEVCIDYLQSALELEFLIDHFAFDQSIDRVVEIGPGYGRTCHAILSNCAIQEYFIIDLPKGVDLCRNYLSKVLSEQQFSKI